MDCNLNKGFVKRKIEQLEEDISRMEQTQGKFPTASRTEYIKLLKEKVESYKRLLPKAKYDRKLVESVFHSRSPRFSVDARKERGKWI